MIALKHHIEALLIESGLERVEPRHQLRRGHVTSAEIGTLARVVLTPLLVLPVEQRRDHEFFAADALLQLVSVFECGPNLVAHTVFNNTLLQFHGLVFVFPPDAEHTLQLLKAVRVVVRHQQFEFGDLLAVLDRAPRQPCRQGEQQEEEHDLYGVEPQQVVGYCDWHIIEQEG
jgi:hypothetical protein